MGRGQGGLGGEEGRAVECGKHSFHTGLLYSRHFSNLVETQNFAVNICRGLLKILKKSSFAALICKISTDCKLTFGQFNLVNQMKSSLSDICHTPNRNLIFCICHTLENKAAVAKSKLQPLHWQQSERPALRKVCLGRNIMAIFLFSEESKNGSKGRNFLTKCLHG